MAEEVKKYYERAYIIFELLKGLKDRDFSMIGNDAPIRGLSVNCIFNFNKALTWAGWKNNKQNLYVSLARLKNIPKFTFNPKTRSDETHPWYINEYSENVISYDLFFDFDNKYELIDQQE